MMSNCTGTVPYALELKWKHFRPLKYKNAEKAFFPRLPGGLLWLLFCNWISVLVPVSSFRWRKVCDYCSATASWGRGREKRQLQVILRWGEQIIKWRRQRVWVLPLHSIIYFTFVMLGKGSEARPRPQDRKNRTTPCAIQNFFRWNCYRQSATGENKSMTARCPFLGCLWTEARNTRVRAYRE